jgi:DNA-binding transcriptional regulator LsrR (DeoR family)
MADVNRLSLLHKVATLYYEKGLKKYDIAHKIKQSPTQVGLLLKEAIEENIVQIKVNLPHFRVLKEALINKFSLADAVVIPHDKDFALLRNNLSQATAEYFETFVGDGKKVAVGGGYLTYQMIEHLEDRLRDIDIYPTAIIGRGYTITHIDPIILVTLLWAKCGHQYGKAHYFTVMPSEDAATNAEIQKHYAEVQKSSKLRKLLREMNEVDFVFTGIGSLNADKTHHPNLSSPKNLAIALRYSEEELKASGVAGDIAYSFFDKAGKTRPEWSVFPSIEIETLKKMSKNSEKRVVVTAGYYKIKSLRTVLDNKLCNVLITDTVSAKTLLE